MNSRETIENVDSVVVSSKVLGDMIGVSDRYIRNLAEQGILVRTGQGRYILKDSIQNYIINLKVQNSSKEKVDNPCDEVEDLNTEKAKNEHVKRQINELKLALMKGKMHRSEDVERVMSDMLTNFKQKVLGIPAKMTQILADRDSAFINKTLTVEMTDLLMDLSNYNPADFYSDEYMEVEDEDDYDG